MVEKILGTGNKLHLWGLAMTYDSHLVVTLRNGIAVIDRDLELTTNKVLTFEDLTDDAVSNSIAIDDKGGICVVSNTTMRKLVWNGTEILGQGEHAEAWEIVYNDNKNTPQSSNSIMARVPHQRSWASTTTRISL
ncbi:MAG: hypothetical protein VB045_00475 [Synergistaceae bacterium]|nr:hypothetical protein [Synergistaceae bacterium]